MGNYDRTTASESTDWHFLVRFSRRHCRGVIHWITDFNISERICVMTTMYAFLIISRGGSLNVRKNRPALSSDEVSFKLKVNLPNDFFNRIIPVIEVSVPKEALYNPEATVAMELLSVELAQKLDLEASDIRDGLKELMQKKLEKQNGEPNPVASESYANENTE